MMIKDRLLMLDHSSNKDSSKIDNDLSALLWSNIDIACMDRHMPSLTKCDICPEEVRHVVPMTYAPTSRLLC
eukprot:scaffold5161_cov64-Cylindrotheca_fusiformis.AAC.2